MSAPDYNDPESKLRLRPSMGRRTRALRRGYYLVARAMIVVIAGLGALSSFAGGPGSDRLLHGVGMGLLWLLGGAIMWAFVGLFIWIDARIPDKPERPVDRA